MALLIILAGCAAPADEPPADVPPAPEPVEYGLPETPRATGLLPVGYQWSCISSACPTYPFTLAGPAEVDLHLTWNVPANDIDVFVYAEDGASVMEGIGAAPQTEERVTARLDAGEYTISIEPFEAASDEYTLVVGFSKPADSTL